MFTTKKTSTAIQSKAKEALGMFTLAINKLKESSQEAEELKVSNQIKIDELSSENDLLTELTDENNAVITNITKLITK